MNLYLISGLGVDRRAFARLQFPETVKACYLDWIPPAGSEESLQNYSLRIASGIDQSSPFMLCGLSMGGMVATEIAKVFPPQKLILLSSTPIAKGLPKAYRLSGKYGLHKMLPAELITKPNFLAHWFLGARNAAERELLDGILRDTDPNFVKWALHSILHWENELVPANLYRIHGSSDRLIPCPPDAEMKISGAGHLMVWTHAEQISGVFEKLLNSC